MRAIEGRRGGPARPLWLILGLWTIPAVVFLMAAGLVVTALSVRELADSAYDRSLAGAIRAIDLNISLESGGVGVELPYPLFASFQATAEGEVYFRVSTDDGLVAIGDALPPLPQIVPPETFTFFDATYLGRPIRLGVYRRPLSEPLYGRPNAQSLVIEVAETTGSRRAFSDQVIRRAVWRDALVIAAAIAFLLLGAHFALRPLTRLREQLDARSADERSPVGVPDLPREVEPLAAAVNGLLARHRLQTETQRRFLDDASHQLKTPIAVLRTQIDYALRSADPERQREAVLSMRPVAERAARTATQLLALARAGNASVSADDHRTAVPVARLAEEVTRLHLAAARKRRIALEIELDGAVENIMGNEPLLFEALSNLVENAVRHSPARGRVLLRVSTTPAKGVRFEVLDGGPGMHVDAILQAGERFRAGDRRERRDGETGAGLGLSIASAIAGAHGGRLALANRPDGGLSAAIELHAPSGTVPAGPLKGG